MHSAASRRDAPAIPASSRRRRKSKEQGFGIDRLPRINALRFAHSPKVETPRFNSAETGSSIRDLGLFYPQGVWIWLDTIVEIRRLARAEIKSAALDVKQ